MVLRRFALLVELLESTAQSKALGNALSKRNARESAENRRPSWRRNSSQAKFSPVLEEWLFDEQDYSTWE
jgi:hypothetical protein